MAEKWPSFEGSPRTKRSVLNFPPLRKVLRLHVARLGADLVLLAHAGVGRRSIYSLACPLCRCSHRARRGLIEPPGQVRLHVAHAAKLASHRSALALDPYPAPADVFATCNRTGLASHGHCGTHALAALSNWCAIFNLRMQRVARESYPESV